MRSLHAAVVVLLIGSLSGAGCGSEAPSRVVPTAPTTVAPTTVAPPSGAMTVSGIVYDTANRPVAGATVEVLDGAQAGMTTTSNASGQYWMTGFLKTAPAFARGGKGI